MPGPTISVLIDTYNHERFIEDAIASVLEQDIDMSSIEVVVVDDGSTDHTPEVVRRFEPRIRLLTKPNGGQASAFNFALPQTSGEIIAMLDGDDRWTKNKLRRVVDTLNNNPQVGIVGHGFFECHTDGRPEGLILPGHVYQISLSSAKDAELFRNIACFLGTSRMTIRRSVLNKILPIPEALVIEADEFIFSLAPAIAPAIILNEPLLHYNLHAENLFQFDEYEPSKVRRKMSVLDVIVNKTPPRLRALGLSEKAIEILFSGTCVEIERMKLSLDGGSSLRTAIVERKAARLAYKHVTWRYRLFQALVLTHALIMPPRAFYRFKRWYSKKGLSKLRRWTGKPSPKVELVESRPPLPRSR